MHKQKSLNASMFKTAEDKVLGLAVIRENMELPFKTWADGEAVFRFKRSVRKRVQMVEEV